MYKYQYVEYLVPGKSLNYNWRIFQGGKQTSHYRGDWKPKEQPATWDKLTKKGGIK